ncbi:Arc family DNA-binding protein [Glaciimonas immobilis]|uniref:Uncharacterized protein (DUF1778 family) n=1 Tax=Glaciimonas immobilis TaxID=728004 RepID=A0A840RNF2_9BURK|nr:Arc family DNA-binding protein [Glaciimonas immobilis]MBB5198622.1 uncharacterized protein (DUF1778 family) [Glaciimonas immobilis]
MKHGDTIAPCFIVRKHRAVLFFGMARNDPQMNLRLPVELKEQIEDAAAKNNRTLTAEVVDRLQQSFEIVAGLKEKEIEALAEKIAARLTDKMKK